MKKLCVLLVTILFLGNVKSETWINSHLHWQDSYDTELVFRQLEDAGVTASIIMPRFYRGPNGGKTRMGDVPASDANVEELAREYPQKFFPLFGLQRNELCDASEWDAGESIVNELEKKLESGIYYGAGELIVRHFAYTKGRCAELDLPIDSNFVQAILDVLKRYDLPLVIHMEADPHQVQSFRNILKKNATSKIVWAHNCGRMQPQMIEAFLDDFPNLFCDLSNMNHNGYYGKGKPRMEPYTYLPFEKRYIDKYQVLLMKKHPDRFLLGSDCCHARGLKKWAITRNINALVDAMSVMTPEEQNKIFRQNAIRVFNLPLDKNIEKRIPN